MTSNYYLMLMKIYIFFIEICFIIVNDLMFFFYNCSNVDILKFYFIIFISDWFCKIIGG